MKQVLGFFIPRSVSRLFFFKCFFSVFFCVVELLICSLIFVPFFCLKMFIPFKKVHLFSDSVSLTTLLMEVSDRKTMKRVQRSVTHIANCIIDSVNR